MVQGLTILLVFTLLTLLLMFLRRSKKSSSNLVANKNKRSNQQPKRANRVSQTTNIAAKAPINTDITPQQADIEIPEALKELTLLTHQDICETQLQATLTMVSRFKKPHPMLMSLAKGQVSQQELVTIVKSDAKIAGRVLFIVNSPRFGVQQPIKDINHAIMYLGLNEVRAIATELALKASFESTNTAQEQSFNKIWQASALASSISLELAKVTGKDNAAELSTLCLLFYLGDLILLSSNPESSSLYKEGVSFAQRVKDTQLTFKTNASIIGSTAASAWELPEAMVKDIECSLSPLTNDQSVNSLDDEDKKDIIICYLACRIAELAVFEQKTRVEQMNILNQGENLHLEFFYINGMLSAYSLTQVQTLLKANDFVHRANALISKHIN